jgi:hypothetical protein
MNDAANAPHSFSIGDQRNRPTINNPGPRQHAKIRPIKDVICSASSKTHSPPDLLMAAGYRAAFPFPTVRN